MNKRERLLSLIQNEDWRSALRLAATCSNLGPHKATITRAHECHWNTTFYRQLGYDPDAAIEAGIRALRELWGQEAATTSSD